MTDTELPLRLDRQDAQQRVVRVSRELLAFAARSYGPLGRATLLQKSARCADTLVLTSTSDRYFQHVNVGDCPIANVYFQMLRSQLRTHSDAGLFLTILSTSLQLEIQEGVLSQMPHPIVLRGLQLALQWSLDYLDDDACPVRIPIGWSSASSLHAVVRGILSTKSAAGLSEQALQESVIPMVVEAFVTMHEHIAQNPSEPMPVRFVYQPGRSSAAKSQFWKHTVFLDFPWPRGCPHRVITNATFALFNITIDPLRVENPDGDTTTEHTSSKDPFKLQALRAIGDTLCRLGVTAVASQKIIPKYLQMYLSGKGVFVLDRLSINHIHAVHQLSGAAVLGDWQVANADESAFGFLSLITTHDIGGKRYIRLHRDANKFAFEELSYSFETALKRLAALAQRPESVAGAGCMEIHLAAHLHAQAELLRLRFPVASEPERKNKSQHDARGVRQLRQVVQAFADCLLRVVTSLGACKAHSDSELLLEQLQAANSPISTARLAEERSEAAELFGWDPSKRCVMPVARYLRSPEDDEEKLVLDAHVLDSFPAKRDALILAVECACSVARIASVVKVS